MFNLDVWDFEPEWLFLSSFFLDYGSRLLFLHALRNGRRQYHSLFFFTLFYRTPFLALPFTFIYFTLGCSVEGKERWSQWKENMTEPRWTRIVFPFFEHRRRLDRNHLQFPKSVKELPLQTMAAGCLPIKRIGILSMWGYCYCKILDCSSISALCLSPSHSCLLLLPQYLRLISKEYRSTVFKGLTDQFAARCKTGWKLLEKSFSRLFLSLCLES
ncbi:hypothetical protein NC653_011978 [Populus alba x Populus x berolinensis]|uniref:Uncharacterized protein n=1 Tax=Populus alba x Populus x berolinensis TaxID=444605 RepID=A0AAD6R3H8_9ROSI|nr:hypothetical protein NC653_011978 [Populus alba x Populus x berolinensis]